MPPQLLTFHPLQQKLSPGAPRLEAFSPKLDRRVMFYRRVILEQRILIEADPAAIAFCERPGYVQASERKYLADFWVRYADREELILVVDKDDDASQALSSRELIGVSMPVRCVPRIELVAARAWIDNWQRMLPCITATRRLVSPTMSTDVERFLRHPAKLVTIEREFSTGDPVLVRAALFCLLHAGQVNAPELRTQPLSLLTNFEAVEASK